jgi:integrase/recombinase XerD
MVTATMPSPISEAVGDEPEWRRALERFRGAYADNTIASCARHFAIFERWCADRGYVALPPAPETVAEYVEVLFRSLSTRTVLIRLYAMRNVSRALGRPDPTLNEPVRLAFRRGKRTYGTRPRQSPPMNAGLRDRIRDACPPTISGLRDRALLGLGYDTLCRRSELVALRIEDISPMADGTAKVIVRQTKEELAGQGVAFISARTLADVRAWLDAAGLTSGPILRQVKGSLVTSKPLHAAFFNDIVKAVALNAGVAPELARRLTSHSMRIGAVQDLAAAGCSLLQIMRAGRWRNAHQVANYARDAPVNVWAQTDGDGYPMAAAVQIWRRRTSTMPRREAAPSINTAGYAARSEDGEV